MSIHSDKKISDPKSSPVARGKRLRSLRMMTSLSRKEVYEKFGLSSSTLQSWEDAKAGGLTEKGAKRAVEVFRKAGVRCAVNWLLYGVGMPPQLTAYDADRERISGGIEEEPISYGVTEDKAIIKELLVFREANHDAIDIVLNDDGMAPFYSQGDYVGGKRRYGEEIELLIGQDCIVETGNNDVLLRRIRRGAKSGVYTLICTNLDASISEVVLYDQEIISAAPVIWHRRKEKSSGDQFNSTKARPKSQSQTEAQITQPTEFE